MLIVARQRKYFSRFKIVFPILPYFPILLYSHCRSFDFDATELQYILMSKAWLLPVICLRYNLTHKALTISFELDRSSKLDEKWF